MNPQNRRIFSIIVHFGDARHTEEAVNSLLGGTVAPDVIIVINHDGSPPLLPSDKRIRLITPKDNGGYAAGINIGLGAVYSLNPKLDDIIVLMNNDIEVMPDTLSRIMKQLGGYKEPAILGTGIKEGENESCALGCVSMLTGRACVGPCKKNLCLPYLHGAFLAASYSVFLKIGGWPEKYFMYWEDVLLGKTARDKGVRLLCSSAIAVSHKQSANRHSGNSDYYRVRNGAHFMENELALPLRLCWRIFNRLRLACHFLKRGPKDPVTLGLLDCARVRLGKRSL